MYNKSVIPRPKPSKARAERSPAVGLIEVSSIAKGYFVLDQMIKKAPIDILLSKTVSPGKYIILISSDVASTEESMRMGLDAASPFLVDSLFIPQLHSEILPAIRMSSPRKRGSQKQKIDSLLIVETATVASTISTLDKGLKAANVMLLELKLGQGLGGKGYFVLTGPLSEIEASLFEMGSPQFTANLLHSEIIARPHEESIPAFAGMTFFAGMTLRGVR